MRLSARNETRLKTQHLETMGALESEAPQHQFKHVVTGTLDELARSFCVRAGQTGERLHDHVGMA
jgi:hypothetical protein